MDMSESYFIHRIKPAIDNGADVTAHINQIYKIQGGQQVCAGAEINCIVFKEDGQSVAVPHELVCFMKELFPEEIEAVAFRDKNPESTEYYKGWRWQFFPKHKNRLEAEYEHWGTT